eukprot:12686960-Alexandrium_andersonii.AAC.1
MQRPPAAAPWRREAPRPTNSTAVAAPPQAERPTQGRLATRPARLRGQRLRRRLRGGRLAQQ